MPRELDTTAAREQLVEDFQKVVADTEALLRAMAAVPGEKASAMRANVEERLNSAKERLRELQGAAYEKTTAAARAADAYAHENPWALIGAAAVIGLLVGLAISSDRR
jgi:ElaB/YqjD/DUF883 family membrane-anchored ribosome-binding protein